MSRIVNTEKTPLFVNTGDIVRASHIVAIEFPHTGVPEGTAYVTSFLNDIEDGDRFMYTDNYGNFIPDMFMVMSLLESTSTTKRYACMTQREFTQNTMYTYGVILCKKGGTSQEAVGYIASHQGTTSTIVHVIMNNVLEGNTLRYVNPETGDKGVVLVYRMNGTSPRVGIAARVLDCWLLYPPGVVAPPVDTVLYRPGTLPLSAKRVSENTSKSILRK
jgi:hypothetical protein